jgi:phosphotransferase system enzyme I (PtsI)
LRDAKVKFDEAVEVGGMIEIPAAALALGPFIKRLDFLSIGTNDLIQYTLAIDRTDQGVAHLYDPLHPAVLRLIYQTIQTGQRAGLVRQRLWRNGGRCATHPPAARHGPAPACRCMPRSCSR